MKSTLGFIGCGNMGTAMLTGILNKGLYEKEQVMVSHLSEAGAHRSEAKFGVKTTLDI